MSLTGGVVCFQVCTPYQELNMVVVKDVLVELRFPYLDGILEVGLVSVLC